MIVAIVFIFASTSVKNPYNFIPWHLAKSQIILQEQRESGWILEQKSSYLFEAVKLQQKIDNSALPYVTFYKKILARVKKGYMINRNYRSWC